MEKKLTNNSIASSLLIRFAKDSDWQQISEVADITWNATYNEAISAENRSEFLRRAYEPKNLIDTIDMPGHWFYVAELSGAVIGFCHFLRRYHSSISRAELVSMYILPDYQNVGVGTFILKTGFSDLAKAGIEQCFVSVHTSNIIARSFYERHGFLFQKKHGQFLETQIVTLSKYARSITKADMDTDTD